MTAKGTRECSFLRPCHFLRTKETAGKRLKVGYCKFLGVHNLICTCVIRAVLSGIPQSNWHSELTLTSISDVPCQLIFQH